MIFGLELKFLQFLGVAFLLAILFIPALRKKYMAWVRGWLETLNPPFSKPLLAEVRDGDDEDWRTFEAAFRFIKPEGFSLADFEAKC